MRKLILIAAISLLATHAYAGGPRSLSLAASNSSQQAPEPAAPAATAPQVSQTPAATQPNLQTATTAPTSTPPAAPAPVTTTSPAATAPAAQSTATPVASPTETIKPKRRQPSTEARVIRELHRHGIYW
ncbi:hypothetical protein GWG65_01815 [Bradyrhizobium sp. CSA207]|uniref:hypothetical protein n=1 Tax=Bradyrhizobium sp. CSA207 TaxID=2698826 RepID=UPI0023B0F4D2|nr:hypothetical protein [Bradyrhizobium sp. CSA207]MDE5440201.1 hypothetical protein [Bradyrhizobium sp. CSA207]